MAHELGCVGVEVRNDLHHPLFGDKSAAEAGRDASALGLKLLALAELSAFTRFNDDTVLRAQVLVENAVNSGAQGVVLIPRCDGCDIGAVERKKNLHTALTELKPLFAEHGLVGFVEPLGFEASALRSKLEAVEAIENVGGQETFKLVHDTFHHFLEGSPQVFAAHTGIVHVSGVVDASVTRTDMLDKHRMLVDKADRLQNIAQLDSLLDEGYSGPVSMEAFAPEVHALSDPCEALRASFGYIANSVRAQ